MQLNSSRRHLLVPFLFLLLAGCSHGPLHEKDYQAWWCNKHHGTLEHRLPDGTRVDCLTREYAVEVEYAPKWAESIGQALYYAQNTGRKPGVLMILRNDGDERFLKRLRVVAKEQGIKVWTVRPKDID
ncbi:MAG TPA: hypothetical protein VIH45_11370 [Desulfuromonadaceae bacterium]